MKILGRNIGLFVDLLDGNGVSPIGMSTSCVIDLNRDVAEVASSGSGGRVFVAGRYGYTIQVDRLFGGDALEVQLLELLTSGEPVSFAVGAATIENGAQVQGRKGFTLEGEVLVTGYTMTSPVQGYCTANVRLTGTGDIYWSKV
jgi:hypothetical protein